MRSIVCKVVCVCFCVLQSCNTQDKLTIFVDPVLSNNIDKNNLKEYFQNNVLEDLSNYRSYTVELKQIFENTASVANSRLLQYLPPEYDESIFSQKERSSRTVAHLFKEQIKLSKQSFINELVNIVTSLDSNSERSGIAEVIVPLSKMQYSSQIILISDLIQDTSTINLRNCHIEKESDVIALAKKHAQKIKDKYIIPDILYDIELIFLIVTKEKENSLYPYLERYWETYFYQFGINVQFKSL
ncbi:hypothetical protein [Tenacibaculum xiamenense]|uniref:hypothetical protein n=1 Tax=Tenacibaculum xiamenense TaxID=1261553 RepID=UPI003894BF10